MPQENHVRSNAIDLARTAVSISKLRGEGDERQRGELMFVLQANFANVSFHPKGSLNFKKLCMVELHSTNDGAALAPALQNLKTLLRYLDRKTSHDERRICEVW